MMTGYRQDTGKKKIADDDEGSERVKRCVRKNEHDRQTEEDKETPEEEGKGGRKDDGVIKEGAKELRTLKEKGKKMIRHT